jgi:hypothetical protein
MAVVGPGVGTATLANPGGNVTQLLINSPSFAPPINAGLAALGAPPGTTLYAQFLRDQQTIVDSGDPINYVALATVAHPIHLLQVVGGTPPPAGCTPSVPPPTNCPDQVVPNSATQALITASAHLPTGTAAPLIRIPAPAAPGPVAITGPVYVNFIEGDHGSIIDGKVLPVTIEMQAESITFAGGSLPPDPAIGFPGFPATPPGTTMFIGNPLVIQP